MAEETKMNPMTDRAELRELIAKAKHLGDGPWSVWASTLWIQAPSAIPGGSSVHVADVRGWGYLTGRGQALALDHDEAFETQQSWAALIVAAVNALPALLDAMDDAEREASVLKDALTHPTPAMLKAFQDGFQNQLSNRHKERFSDALSKMESAEAVGLRSMLKVALALTTPPGKAGPR